MDGNTWDAFLQTVATALRHAGIYIANGGLVTLYWLSAHLAQLGALALLAAMGVLDYTEAQRLNPTLHARGNWWALGLRYTLLTAGLWLVTAFVIPAPVPVLGLVLLTATLFLALTDPAQRHQHLTRGRGAVSLYALACLGLRVYLALDADVYGWAAALGGLEVAEQALAQGRSMVQIIAMLAILYGVPVGHLALVVQRVLATPPSMVTTRQSLQQIVYALRTRGGLSE